ncbi:UDP binding domain-containing protein, partial [Bacillus cereus]|nr:UDP binding domain-containing protein [Bacillus cereus]
IVKYLTDLDVGEVKVVEPHINSLPKDLVDKDIELVNLYEAITIADIIVVLVDHEVFYSIDKNILKEKIVIDTRGII